MSENKSTLAENINEILEKIEEYDNAITAVKLSIQSKLQEINLLAGKENRKDGKEVRVTAGRNEIFDFMKGFFSLAEKIMTDKVFVKYTYETKYSALYYKIEQVVFENYINRYAQMDSAKFLNYCIDLNLIKSEKNRKCIYNSGEIRIYYLNKNFLDAATAKAVDT